MTLTDNPLEKYDLTFGTSLAPAEIHVKSPFKGFFRSLPEKFFLRINEVPVLHQHLLMHYFYSLRESYDLCFSAYNEMDLGECGIQYFHDKPGSCIGPLLVQRIFGYSNMRMQNNISLVPSAWMARRVEAAYGMESMVVYPPVRSVFPAKDWTERVNGFLCVARFSPEKRIEKAIEIIAQVRKNGFDVSLRIVTLGGKANYERHIRKRCADHGNWIHIDQDLTNDQYVRLLSEYRYYLNASKNEGFGIAIFEAINAGCIPFVLGSGGQQEGLDQYTEFIFNKTNKAIKVISEILKSENLQKAALQKLFLLRGHFSVDRFRAEIMNITNDFFEKDL